jgi:SAM-dependent methyltransferase
MATTERELVTDELDVLRRLVPLDRARLIELGCGKADMARRLLESAAVESVTALEVDEVQLQQNIADPRLARIEFVRAGAEAIPRPDASYDVAMMLKSLHHVPLDRLDDALAEISRVLRPGGYLYVSEPVYAGDFNDIVRLFHDEKVVREAAYAALVRAVDAGLFESMPETTFDTPLFFGDFDDFVAKVVNVTHSQLALEGDALAEVRRRFDRFMTPTDERFLRAMRINVLRSPH